MQVCWCCRLVLHESSMLIVLVPLLLYKSYPAFVLCVVVELHSYSLKLHIAVYKAPLLCLCICGG